eukprot:CCRYP_009500-RA/>CCRYP_009500-RA protein AED:0.28 eAED:0.28 QI:1468/1/1/1/0.6/0.5/6/139/1106
MGLNVNFPQCCPSKKGLHHESSEQGSGSSPKMLSFLWLQLFYNAKMKAQYFASVMISMLLSVVPTTFATNLRQKKRLTEGSAFDPKAGKHEKMSSKSVNVKDAKSSKSTDAKAAKAAVTPTPRPSTPSTSECGVYWYRSHSLLNPNSCTNDKNFPADDSKLYATVQECCKAEFGKVHGCNVYNVCRQTPHPSPPPVPTPSPSNCGVYWHRSQSALNPNSCTNDENLPKDPSKWYATVQECCKAEFGKVAGCNVYRVSCPGSGEPTSGRPTPSIPASEPDAESPPPTGLNRRTLADHLNEFYRSRNTTNDRKELRDLLKESVIDASDLKDMISGSHHGSASSIASISQQRDVSASYNKLSESFLDLRVTSRCKCVDCPYDNVCGGLWKGNGQIDEDETDRDVRIHLVVSHCKSSLDWMQQFVEGFAIDSIHIITKCDYPVVGALDSATILKMPNVGRCDHTYAWFMANLLPRLAPEDDEENSVIVFLKDDISYENMHQFGEWSELRHLTQMAASNHGFACGITSLNVTFSQSHFSLSAFHKTETLQEFAMATYQRNLKGYLLDPTEFKSPFNSLGLWWDSLGIESTGDLTPVCYGGVFAASVRNIRRHTTEFWDAIETALSRGNNIQEGHYAERTWALLLSTPLQDFQVDALMEHSDGVYINMSSMHGALMKLPKLFLHIGVKATSSTEVLAESLVQYIPELELDGYRVAVHGKHNPIEHDFPNIDRLGSCMWSDIIKQSFPSYMQEATKCPDKLLSELSHYMENTFRKDQDLVVLNPWLSRPGTADSLSLYFDPSWEVHTIIYYRRYFEWITLVFEDWRLEILEHVLSPELLPYSSFRYIDFIREYCKRLFYGKDVNEDGYPIRPLGETSSKLAFQDGFTSKHYDPTSNFRVEELTDLPDYTYFVAKEYSSHSRFRRHVTIVNYHEANSIETNFYCRVLHDANNACNAAFSKSQEHLETKNVKFAQVNSQFPVPTYQVAEDLVIAAYKAGRLQVDSALLSKDFKSQIRLWIQMVESAFEKNATLIYDLPIECLYTFEVERLLEVSLAYERILLPAFYDSSRGASDLVQEFRNWHFCSVHAEKVLASEEWDFLFDITSSSKASMGIL